MGTFYNLSGTGCYSLTIPQIAVPCPIDYAPVVSLAGMVGGDFGFARNTLLLAGYRVVSQCTTDAGASQNGTVTSASFVLGGPQLLGAPVNVSYSKPSCP